MLKRIICLALAALLLTVSAAVAEGELRGYSKENGYVYVALGQYPQTAEGGVEPILWRILTVEDDRAYLCSEYVLFARPMHPDYTEYKTIGKDFGNTELCRYLNAEFSETAFTAEELSLLVPYETYGKVFLLDAEDLKNTDYGMGVGVGLKAWGTPYAIANGLFVYMNRYGGHSPYWVRNQSTTDVRHARCTKQGDTIGHIVADRDNEGVRPAAYLDLSLAAVSGGSGTQEDPYTLTLSGSGETAE